MLRREFFELAMASVVAPHLFPSSQSETASQQPFPVVDGLTREVVDFILRTNYSDIPAEVIELGKKSILDGLGLSLAGSQAESGHIAREFIRGSELCRGSSTVSGTSMKVPPRFAAFLNGISIHAFDFDDTQLAVGPDRVYGLLMHPTVTALPPAFAIGETAGVSGKDLMLAYHLGAEVECKIALAISPRSYHSHITGICGPFGSAAAGIKLRKLDENQSLNAFGVAATAGGGLRTNFGTMTKPFHAGHAAEGGLVAVELAALGWTASHTALEAPGGFFNAYGGAQEYEPDFLTKQLGNPWVFSSPGVSIKPFPCGSLTHPGMDEMLRMIQQYDIKPKDVESVEVGTNKFALGSLIHHDPHTSLEAKFSMEFCLAILLIERKAGLPQFTDAVVNRPDVQAMIHRIRYSASSAAASAGLNTMSTIIHIHLKDGRTLSGHAEYALGSPQHPMSYEQVADKFRGCAEYAHWPNEKSEKIIEAVRTLESIADIRQLSPLLSVEKG
ncbi:MAG TPA: MmgE/PrpD family protein [Bryobacteraceae bacterium]|jgi:2-methylcitrate dehydratase PrpD|nr:MmgE/PrpD family protein [Bryobacteraceae bacterium]